MDVPEFFATNPHYVQSGQQYNRNHALSRFVLDLFRSVIVQDRRHMFCNTIFVVKIWPRVWILD